MHDRPPLIVATGIGRDSTGMLVGMEERGLRPDLLIYGDTGGEWPETYEYIPTLNEWLRKVGFPEITIVRHKAKLDATLEANCVRLNCLPSIAFNFGSCSDRWKQGPQRKFVNHWLPARKAWQQGRKVVKAIGFECTETRRINRAGTYQVKKQEKKYRNWFPLVEWGWTLADCVLAIHRAGLGVPRKSACWFCSASKEEEIVELSEKHPDLFVRALVMEQLARTRTHPPLLTKIKGLGGRKFAWRDLPCAAPFLDRVDRILMALRQAA